MYLILFKAFRNSTTFLFVGCLPPLLTNGTVISPDEYFYEYGQTLFVSCAEGLRLAAGDSVLFCSNDGMWHGDEPQCVIVEGETFSA